MKKRVPVALRREWLDHAFSPDGKWVAVATQRAPLRVLYLPAMKVVELGPGTSPSWSPGGRLYFRRPGRRPWRDEVVYAEAGDWQVKVLFDLPGTPLYPRRLSARPPWVDVLEGGNRLYTMFYRLEKRDGAEALLRWKVVLDAGGTLLSRKAEQLSE